MAKQKEAWDKLSMQEKAQLIKLSVDNGVSSLKQIRDTYNLYANDGKKSSAVDRPRDIDEAIYISRNTPYNKNIDDVEGPGYREYMWKLAQAKSKVWGISPQEAYESFIHPSEFNYRRWYNLASQDELDNALTNGDAHWMDVFGKTVGADTFSNESPYSGYSNPYNPKGITGGTWTGRLGIDEYIPSESQIDNDWPLNKAWFAIDRGNKYYQEKISKGEDTHEVPSIMTYNNGVMLPEITVTPRGNYIEYYPYANGGDLAHKYDGKQVGQSQELQRIPEVSIIEEPWADAWFKDNKNVAGMAIGKGLNGVDGDRRVIINPYNTQMNDSTSRASVLLNERLRHLMDQENFSLPNITKEQMQKYKGTSYQGDTLNIGRTEVARYLSGDPSHNLTDSQKQYIDSLKLNHKKSTGGPLYPFSFEKNPFLKTPVVRYDEGGKKQDALNPGGYTDEQLNKNYQIWKTYDPTGGLNFINYLMSQGFGNLARGEENEYWKEYLGLDSAVPLMNSNAHTEWDKQIEAQKKQNGELASDFYGTTPRMDYNIQALADTLMLGNMVRNYEEYDKKYNLPHIETVTEAYEQAKNILNNPNKWTLVDGEIPIGQYKYDPETSETNPLGMLANFGMKWVPEENALYMHDTYDFPSRVHKKTEIPVRPREMKIRSKINFDPTKGSWLLRSPVNYNTNIPAKTTK